MVMVIPLFLSLIHIFVTVPSTNGVEPVDYALQVLRQWGVGSAEKNNGVVLLLSMDPREIQISVGYGLEGRLNDGKCGRILDTYAMPSLREGDYDTGILQTYKAIFTEVCEEYGLDADQVYTDMYVDTSELESNGTSTGSIIGLSLIHISAGTGTGIFPSPANVSRCHNGATKKRSDFQIAPFSFAFLLLWRSRLC